MSGMLRILFFSLLKIKAKELNITLEVSYGLSAVFIIMVLILLS